MCKDIKIEENAGVKVSCVHTRSCSLIGLLVMMNIKLLALGTMSVRLPADCFLSLSFRVPEK